MEEKRTRLDSSRRRNTSMTLVIIINLFILILFALKFAVITCEQTATSATLNPVLLNRNEDRKAQVHANLPAADEQRVYYRSNDDNPTLRLPGDEILGGSENRISLQLSSHRAKREDDEKDLLLMSDSLRPKERLTRKQTADGNAVREAFHSPVTELSRLDSNSTGPTTVVQSHKVDLPQTQRAGNINRQTSLRLSNESRQPLDLLRQSKSSLRPNATQQASNSANSSDPALPDHLSDETDLIGEQNYLHFEHQLSEDGQQAIAEDVRSSALDANNPPAPAADQVSAKRNIDATLEARAKLQDTVAQLHFNKTLALANFGSNSTGSDRWSQSSPAQSDSFDSPSPSGPDFEQPFNQELSSSIVSVSVTVAPTNVVDYLNEQQTGSDLLEAADELQQQRQTHTDSGRPSSKVVAADWGRRKSASFTRPQVRAELSTKSIQNFQRISNDSSTGVPVGSASYEDIVTWTPAAGPAAYRAGSGFGPSPNVDHPLVVVNVSSLNPNTHQFNSNASSFIEPYIEPIVSFPAPATSGNVPSGSKKRNGTSDYLMSDSNLDYVANETQHGGFMAADPPPSFKRGQQRIRLKSQPAMWHLKKPSASDSEYTPESSDGFSSNAVAPLGHRKKSQQVRDEDDSDNEDPEEDDDNESSSPRERQQKPRGSVLQTENSLHIARDHLSPVRPKTDDDEDSSSDRQPAQSEERHREQVGQPSRGRARVANRQKARKNPNDDWESQQQTRPHQQQGYDRGTSGLESVHWSPTLAPTAREPQRFAQDTNQQVPESRRPHESDVVVGSRAPEPEDSSRGDDHSRETPPGRYQQADQNGFRGSTSVSSSSSPPIIRTFRVTNELNFAPTSAESSKQGSHFQGSVYNNNNNNTSSSSNARPTQQDSPWANEASTRFQASHHRQVNYNPSMSGDISMVRPARPQQLLGGFAPHTSQLTPQQPVRVHQTPAFAPRLQQQQQMQQLNQSPQQQPAKFQQGYRDSSFATPFEPPRSQQVNSDSQRQPQFYNQYPDNRFNAPPAQPFHQTQHQVQFQQQPMSSNEQEVGGQRQHFMPAPRPEPPVRPQSNEHYSNGSSSNGTWSIVTLPYPQPTNNPQSYFSLYNPGVGRQPMQPQSPQSPSTLIYSYKPNHPAAGWSNNQAEGNHEYLSNAQVIRPMTSPFDRQVGSQMEPMRERSNLFNMPSPQLGDLSRSQVNLQQQQSGPESQSSYQDHQSIRGTRNAPASPPSNGHNSYLTINLKTHAAVGPNQLFWEAAAREVAQQQSGGKDQDTSKAPVTNGHLPPRHRELPADALPMMRRPLTSLRFPLQEPFMAGSHTNGHAYAGTLKTPHMAAAAMMADLNELAQLQSMSANPHEISYVDPHSFYPISLASPLDANPFNFMTSATMPTTAFVAPSESNSGRLNGDLDNIDQPQFTGRFNAVGNGNANGAPSNSSQFLKKGTAIISSALPLATPSTVQDPFGWPMGYGSEAATTLLKVNHVAPPPPYLVPAKVTAAQTSALFYPTMIEPGASGATAVPVKEDPSIISQQPYTAESSLTDYAVQWPSASPMMAEYSMLQPQVWAPPDSTSDGNSGAKLNHIKVELNTRPPVSRRVRLRHLLRMFSSMRSRSPNDSSTVAANITSAGNKRQKRSIMTNIVTNLIKQPTALLTGKSESIDSKQKQQRQAPKPPKLALAKLSEPSTQSHHSAKMGFIPLLDNANMIESMESDLLAQAIMFNHQHPQTKLNEHPLGRDPMEQMAEAHSMRVVSHTPLSNQPVSHADPPSASELHSFSLAQQQQQMAQDSDMMLYMPMEEAASLSPPANEPHALIDQQQQQASQSAVPASSRERLKRLSKSIIRSSRKPLTKLIKMTSSFRLPSTNHSAASSAAASSQVSIAQKLNTVVSPSVMMAPSSVPSLNNFNRFALPLQQWYQYQIHQAQVQNQLNVGNELAKFRPTVVSQPKQQHNLLPLATPYAQQMSPYTLVTATSAKQQQFSQPMQVHFGFPPNQLVATQNQLKQGERLHVASNVSFPSDQNEQQPRSNMDSAGGIVHPAPTGLDRASSLLGSPQRADSMNRFTQVLADLQLYNRDQLISPLFKISRGAGSSSEGQPAMPPHRSTLLLDLNNPSRRQLSSGHFRRSNGPFLGPHFNLSRVQTNLSFLPQNHRQQWYPPSAADRQSAWERQMNNSELAKAIKRDFNMRFKPSARTRQLNDFSDMSLFYKPTGNVTYTDEVYTPSGNTPSMELSSNELSESTMMADGTSSLNESNLSQLMGSPSSVEGSQSLMGFGGQDSGKLPAMDSSASSNGDFTLEQQQQFQQLLNQQQQQNMMQFDALNGQAMLSKPRLPKIIPSINSMANKFRQHLMQTLKLNPLASKWPTLTSYPKYQSNTNYMALSSMPMETQFQQQQIPAHDFQQKQPLDNSFMTGSHFNGLSSADSQKEQQISQFHNLQQRPSPQQPHQFQHQPMSSPQEAFPQTLNSNGPNGDSSGVHLDEMGGEGPPLEDSSLFSEKPLAEPSFRPDNETLMSFNQVNGSLSDDTPHHGGSLDMYDHELMNQHSMQADSLPGMMMTNGSASTLGEMYGSNLFSNQSLMGGEQQSQHHEVAAPLRDGMVDVSNNLLASDGTYIPEKSAVKSNYSEFGSHSFKDDPNDPTLYHNRNLSAAASTDAADVTIHHHHVITTSDDSDGDKIEQVKHMMSGMESPVHPGGLDMSQMQQSDNHLYQNAESDATGNSTVDQQQKVGSSDGSAYQANFESTRTGNGSLDDPEEQQQQNQHYEAERMHVRPAAGASYHTQHNAPRQRKIAPNQNTARVRAYANVTEQMPARQVAAQQQPADYQVIKASDWPGAPTQASGNMDWAGPFRMRKVHMPESMLPNGMEVGNEPGLPSSSPVNGEVQGDSSEDQQQQFGGQQVYEPDGLGASHMMYTEQSIGEQREHQAPQLAENPPNHQQHLYLHSNNLTELQPTGRAQVVMGHYKAANTSAPDGQLEYNFTPVFQRYSEPASNYSSIGSGQRAPATASSSRSPATWRSFRGELQLIQNNSLSEARPRGSPTSATTSHEQYLVLEQQVAPGSHSDSSTTSATVARQPELPASSSNGSELPAVFVSVKPERVVQQVQVRRQPLKMPKSARPRNQNKSNGTELAKLVVPGKQLNGAANMSAFPAASELQASQTKLNLTTSGSADENIKNHNLKPTTGKPLISRDSSTQPPKSRIRWQGMSGNRGNSTGPSSTPPPATKTGQLESAGSELSRREQVYLVSKMTAAAYSEANATTPSPVSAGASLNATSEQPSGLSNHKNHSSYAAAANSSAAAVATDRPEADSPPEAATKRRGSKQTRADLIQSQARAEATRSQPANHKRVSTRPNSRTGSTSFRLSANGALPGSPPAAPPTPTTVPPRRAPADLAPPSTLPNVTHFSERPTVFVDETAALAPEPTNLTSGFTPRSGPLAVGPELDEIRRLAVGPDREVQTLAVGPPERDAIQTLASNRTISIARDEPAQGLFLEEHLREDSKLADDRLEVQVRKRRDREPSSELTDLLKMSVRRRSESEAADLRVRAPAAGADQEADVLNLTGGGKHSSD